MSAVIMSAVAMSVVAMSAVIMRAVIVSCMVMRSVVVACVRVLVAAVGVRIHRGHNTPWGYQPSNAIGIPGTRMET